MAEDIEKSVVFSPERKIQFIAKAPRVVDIVSDSDRKNQLKSIDINPRSFERSERPVFTEKEGLEDLVDFLDLTFQTAKTKGDTEMIENVSLFKENVVFVGEKELKKATQGIAHHLFDIAREGKDVYFLPGWRSERYITLRILEEIDCLAEKSVDLRKKIKLSESPKTIAENCKNSLKDCLIAVADDFVISGTRIQGFTTSMYNSLLREGFSQEKASTLIEANVVALSDRGKDKLSMGCGEKEVDLKIFSYYSIPEYRNSKDKWVVFTGVSISGSHSSTDYGFEKVLEDFWEYLVKNGVERNRPLLLNVVRPYEREAGSKYKDSSLQSRWDKIRAEYGIELAKQ